MKKILIVFIALNSFAAYGQKSKLIINDKAVVKLLNWFENSKSKKTNEIASYTSCKVMEIICREYSETKPPAFKTVLKKFNPLDTLTGKGYGLREAYEKRSEIKELKNLLDKTNFNDFFNTVKYFFPKGYESTNNYNVFFTLTGWKWGDAMQFTYKIENEKITFPYDGKPALIFNLTLINKNYGKTLDKKISSFSKVFAHELFHAMFSEYVKKNWDDISEKKPKGFLKYTMLNEGIAHYIGEKESLKENYKTEFKDKEKAAFDTFSEKLKQINTSSIEDKEKRKIIRKGTHGNFWDKYVCITGMFMAFHIENECGIEGLRECINKGYDYFIKKYISISENNDNMPKLPKFIK